ncbi:CD3324 family protein [Paenibacillus polysaccharolyticus]|uniref:CD3324 family protein n=1 Tax=Paenibacillus polysaccharolyticus TaxID=582692 RepID=UPI00203BEE2D|nr:CD3324 family protein [Paenibacillus polysaccharolyticus]
MKYTNADAILPEALIKEIQRRFPGGLIYIPKPKEARIKWGERSGSREWIQERNREMCNRYTQGETIEQLAARFCLSIDSIKKIVYCRKNRKNR